MRLARIGPAGSERPVVVDASGAGWDATSVTADFDGAFLAADGLARLRAAVAAGSLAPVELTGRYGPPVARPGKVVCIGLNYRDHAAESGMPPPAEPVVFMKAPNTVVGPADPVLIPRRSEKTDYEVELGVVIGQTARYLDDEAAAAAAIAGYAASNDVTEREFQLERGGQWDKGKSCETFNPLGPWLVTTDELADPQAVALRLWVNDELRQNGSTQDMIFGVHHLVWYLSQFMVLEPGDLINTGTPAGVGLGSGRYLRADDVVELEIDGLGRQRSTLVPA